jgi:hypothetical protein
MSTITPEAKASLPRDISFKMFRGGGGWNSQSTSRLGFLAKIFVLIKALRKRWFIIVEDEENGLSIEQFAKLQKNREYSVHAAEEIRLQGGFVLGSKELMDYFQYLNNLSTSPAYNFLMRNKNMPTHKVEEANREMAYIIKFIAFWESNKKSVVADTGLSMPEVYVLLCLFDGREALGADIYNKRFRRAYQSSPGKIRMAFCTLEAKKYIAKYGKSKGMRLQITGLGKDATRSLVMKYGVNC